MSLSMVIVLSVAICAEPWRIAHWNWKTASEENRSANEIRLTVNLILQATPDVMALQEILYDGIIPALVDELNRRGLAYAGNTSPETGGERLAFIWNTRNVILVGVPLCKISKIRSCEIPGSSLSRGRQRSECLVDP